MAQHDIGCQKDIEIRLAGAKDEISEVVARLAGMTDAMRALLERSANDLAAVSKAHPKRANW
jgi:hypothetical protein